MEPYIMLTFSKSKLDDLGNELDTLQNLVSQATENGHDGADAISLQLNAIQKYTDIARSETQSLLNQTEDLVNQNINSVNEVSATVAEALDRLVPISNHLMDMSTSITNCLEPLQDALADLLKASDSIEDGFGNLKTLNKDMNRVIDDVDTALVQFNKGMNFINEAMDYLLKGKLISAVQSIKKASSTLDQSSTSLHHALMNLEDVSFSLDDVLESGDDVNYYIGQSADSVYEAVEVMKDASNSFTNALAELSALAQYLSDQPEVSFSTSDSNYQETKNNLSEALGDTSSALSELNTIVNEKSHVLLDNMQAITNQLFVVFDIMLGITEEVSSFDVNLEERKEDISGNDTEQQTEGKVANCLNEGIIAGDINVGGIAGAVAIERSFDPEDDIEIRGDKSLNFIYQTRAVIRECQNTGEIKAKKDAAGGISGSMKLGYVVNSISQGHIQSSSGNYVGGIVGQSDALIRSSYAKCTLSGGKYIGGIAGQGKDILDSLSHSRIDASDEYIGAIAGDIQSDGKVSTNYFVDDSLGGIDNISYMSKAEPMSYEAFIQLENIPNIFLEFSLNFWIDNKLVETIPFSYGDSLEQSQLPSLPEKAGYYGSWEAFDYSNLTFNNDIEAIYTALVSTLESSERQNDSMPILLVQGQFTESDYLTLTPNNYPSIILADNQVELEQWSVTIPTDGNKAHTLRYLPPTHSDNIEIYSLKEDTWVQVSTQRDGKYIIFETDDNPIIFSVVSSAESFPEEIVILGIVVFMLILLLLWIRKKKTTHKPPITESI